MGTTWQGYNYDADLRRETIGSPALGQGSNWRLKVAISRLPHLGYVRKNVQGVFQMFIDFHDCGLISASVTVVGGFCVSISSWIVGSVLVYLPEKMVTTFRSCDQLYPSITS